MKRWYLVYACVVVLAGCGVPDTALQSRQGASDGTPFPTTTAAPSATIIATDSLVPTDVPTNVPTAIPPPQSPTPLAVRSFTPALTLLPDAEDGVTAFALADSDHGWLGYGAALLATDDGGQRWTQRYQAAGTIEALDFVSPNHGWLVSGGVLWATADAGASWRQLTGAPPDVRQIDLIDHDHGWIGGVQQAFLLHTDDGGATWTANRDPCMKNDGYGSASLFRFLDPTIGWMLCVQGTGMTSGSFQAKQLFKTEDGGRNWILINQTSFDGDAPGALPLSGNANGLFFLDTATGWISDSAPVCLCGGARVTSDGGHSWSERLPFPRERTITTLRFVSHTQGYALAAKWRTTQALIQTTDGGASWTQLYPALFPTSMPHFSDPLHGTAQGSVADPQAILATFDGGTTWTMCAANTCAVDTSDRPHQGQVRWQIDGEERLLASFDGGVHWTRYDFGVRRGVADAFFLDATFGWFIDYGGHLYATTDGGQRWVQQT